MGVWDHLKHEIDVPRMMRYKKPIALFIAAHVVFALPYLEEYYHNWYQNKRLWSYSKQHRGKGLVTPYIVKYDEKRVRDKNIEVVWETIRQDVA